MHTPVLIFLLGRSCLLVIQFAQLIKLGRDVCKPYFYMFNIRDLTFNRETEIRIPENTDMKENVTLTE